MNVNDVHPPPVAVEVQPTGLVLTWAEGTTTQLRADALRTACRCGDCRRNAVAGRTAPVAAGLALVTVEAAGAYGLRLIFSDGHDRGIYPWSLMRDLEDLNR
ncbi:MAG: DUF971 domain-containing protein [Pseudomonadota bacterium]